MKAQQDYNESWKQNWKRIKNESIHLSIFDSMVLFPKALGFSTPFKGQLPFVWLLAFPTIEARASNKLLWGW